MASTEEAAAAAASPEKKMEVDDPEEDDVMAEVLKMSTDEIKARTRLLDNDIRIMKSEIVRIQHELQAQRDKIKENTEKIKVIVAMGVHEKLIFCTTILRSYFFSFYVTFMQLFLDSE